MLKKRKAQGLSITTIVVAIIALIVIVVLILMFTGKLGDFSKGLDDVRTCEKTCTALNMDKQDSTCGNDDTPISDECCCKPK